MLHTSPRRRPLATHAAWRLNRGDRSTFFWNPFRKRLGVQPSRRHRTARIGIAGTTRRRDFAIGLVADQSAPPLWIGADTPIRGGPEYNTPPELYNLDCVAYESLVLGLFTIWHGERPEREKPNDISLGYSRDGFHWSAPEPRRVHRRLGTARRLELGQRAVGGRLLPGGRRRALLLRQRPPG